MALLRDPASARAAFASGGAYLTPAAGDGPAPSALGPEMSRRMRALPVWCALRAAGREGYREMVERCLDNAAGFAAWVEATPGLELLAPAPTIIVCFRVAPAGPDAAATDDLNRRVVAGLQADGRAFVTGTVWDGKAAIRAAFDNWTTRPADVAILQGAILDVVAESVVGRRKSVDGSR